MAERTRSLLSLTALSGSPTVEKAGNPRAESTSTSTRKASTPITELLKTFASIFPLRHFTLEKRPL